MNTIHLLAAAAVSLTAATPAFADKAPEVTLVHCDASLGTIAVVDGDTQGWTKYGLSSPRELIVAMATQSGCFTPHSPASGHPADFLINAIAGDKEEVDQGVSVAKTALTEGLVRSGAAGQLAGHVPMVGGMLGMFGGFGGKKKTYAAGLRVLDPTSGQTLVAGSGEAKKNVVTFAGAGSYGESKDGQLLATAFIGAFNAIVAQAPTLQSAKAAMPAPAPAAPAGYIAAIDTQMLATPAAGGARVRAVRAATSLAPTGKREGLFVEVKDNFGTTGWVSVEDLK